MHRDSREWNRACLVHSMLYSHLPYILFTAFFSKSHNPSPGRSGAFRKTFPASTRHSPPMIAPPGPVVVRGGEWLQYRARVVVIYVFTAPVRRFSARQRRARSRVRTWSACAASAHPSQHSLTIDNLLSNN